MAVAAELALNTFCGLTTKEVGDGVGVEGGAAKGWRRNREGSGVGGVVECVNRGGGSDVNGRANGRKKSECSGGKGTVADAACFI